MVHLDPRPAVHLRDLPCDPRGYLVPAEAPWTEDGEPQLSKLEPNLVIMLTAYRACAVCGFSLQRDELVWRIVDEYSRGTTFDDMVQGDSSFNDPPGHFVCMLYSSLVCPYWKTPGSRLSKESVYQPGGRRGEVASILGFKDYALLMDSRPGPDGSREKMLLYQDYEREVEFRDPVQDLADMYEAERKLCGGRYVQNKRHHYAPKFGGSTRLRKEAIHASNLMTQQGPDDYVPMDGRPFAMFQSGWS